MFLFGKSKKPCVLPRYFVTDWEEYENPARALMSYPAHGNSFVIEIVIHEFRRSFELSQANHDAEGTQYAVAICFEIRIFT